jgi:RNA polymerase sigma factor (sigma-70 family)
VDPDGALVEAAASGSREAFDELVRRHQAAIVTLVRALTGGRDDAEDLAQEVFVRAWRSLRGFRGESAFRTWLHRVAINVVRTSQTRRTRLLRILVPSGGMRDEDAPAPEAVDAEEPVDTALAATDRGTRTRDAARRSSARGDAAGFAGAGLQRHRRGARGTDGDRGVEDLSCETAAEAALGAAD